MDAITGKLVPASTPSISTGYSAIGTMLSGSAAAETEARAHSDSPARIIGRGPNRSTARPAKGRRTTFPEPMDEMVQTRFVLESARGPECSIAV